jgi:hypothetical protein
MKKGAGAAEKNDSLIFITPTGDKILYSYTQLSSSSLISGLFRPFAWRIKIGIKALRRRWSLVDLIVHPDKLPQRVVDTADGLPFVDSGCNIAVVIVGIAVI